MGNRYISENNKRKLYAESMGRCMNPNCCKELFCENGDIIEKAHIDSWCKTTDNSYENLILLCPNCHTEFDKNKSFTQEDVLQWKEIRRKQLEKFYSKQYETFEELQKEVAPILQENKTIYERYYLNDNKTLWDTFEYKLIANNRKLKILFLANLNLMQQHQEKSYSNLAYIQDFIGHVDEFEATRTAEEKNREILFPVEINSMFGIAPMKDFILPSTESLELLIEKLKKQGKFEKVNLGNSHPNIQIKEGEKRKTIFLDDTPRLRQLYYDYKCFVGSKVRLQSLNYALKYIRSRKVDFDFVSDNNLRKISIKGKNMLFIYEYCLSHSALESLTPEENSIVVNLHNWNGSSCISKEAYNVAKSMNVLLLTMEEFYEYINKIK